MNRLRRTVEVAARWFARRRREGNVPASLALNRLLGF